MDFIEGERNEKLSVVSVQIVMNRGFRDDGTLVRGVVYKINRRGPGAQPEVHHTEADKLKTNNP
jgi:hypothetical protein